jgi:hypothetical protein
MFFYYKGTAPVKKQNDFHHILTITARQCQALHDFYHFAGFDNYLLLAKIV